MFRFADEYGENMEFNGRQVCLLSLHQNLEPVKIDMQVSKITNAFDFSFMVDAPKQSVDASQELGSGEGLDDIVIGAALQALHLAFSLAFHGHHDDGQARRLRLPF